MQIVDPLSSQDEKTRARRALQYAVKEVDKIYRTDYSGSFKEEICEHYQPKGQCLTKGCKYAK